MRFCDVKRVSVFGSTGFVGQKAVQILHNNPADFAVEALVARDNVRLLASQAKLLNAQVAVIADEKCHQALTDALSGTEIKVLAGRDGVMEAAAIRSVDCVLMAITGISSLEPTIRLIDAGVGSIALASKESLVCGAALLMEAARSKNVSIVPVDSEHNSIFRLLTDRTSLNKVVITASGGPFLHCTSDKLGDVTPEDALTHPVWEMGKKISIDSATMANKALEVIEASYLFSLGHDKIDVVVHPESVVHALVSYVDGTSVALMYPPDMSIPILHALYWPEGKGSYENRLDLVARGQLTFLSPDLDKFSLLKLGFDVLKSKNSHAKGIAFNAANEMAVESFLAGGISFLQISEVVKGVMDRISYCEIRSLGEVIEYDLLVREEAKRAIGSLKLC